MRRLLLAFFYECSWRLGNRFRRKFACIAQRGRAYLVGLAPHCLYLRQLNSEDLCRWYPCVFIFCAGLL